LGWLLQVRELVSWAGCFRLWVGVLSLYVVWPLSVHIFKLPSIILNSRVTWHNWTGATEGLPFLHEFVIKAISMLKIPLLRFTPEFTKCVSEQELCRAPTEPEKNLKGEDNP
jgi:hypothetical protein